MTPLVLLALICLLQFLALVWALFEVQDLQERLATLNRHRLAILPPDDTINLRRRNPPC